MCGVRTAGFRVTHQFAITVICRDEQNPGGFLNGLGNAAEAGSTVSTALIAAGRSPVWPTMSGLA